MISVMLDCCREYEMVCISVFLSHRLTFHRWRGFNYKNKPLDTVQIERKQLDKVYLDLVNEIFARDLVNLVLSLNGSCVILFVQERTLEEHMKLVQKILKRDEKRRKRIEAAGIDYEWPEIVSILLLYAFQSAVAFALDNNFYQKSCKVFSLGLVLILLNLALVCVLSGY